MDKIKPMVAGEGTTHWYECECGCVLDPYEEMCPECMKLIDWSEEYE